VDPVRRLRFGVAVFGAVIAVGTLGYLVLGFSPLDALYQTVTTVSTVGFREVEPLDGVGQVFTIVLILLGVGTALFTLGALVEALVEGQLRDMMGRRRMDKRIATRTGHVVVCGYGRVGRAFAGYAAGNGLHVVVVDNDPERVRGIEFESVVGDVNDDRVLMAAGIERARALVAALASDADNLVLTLTGRALCPGLFIVARARFDTTEQKLLLAGADRVVNPQRIGGQRMAAFVSSPHVAEFLDVVMHDGSLEFRLEEVAVPAASPLGGRTLREAHVRDRTGALVLAIRGPDGRFATNPEPETVIQPGDVLIAIGTAEQVAALAAVVRP
jgi:voltage-gated potassium channel